MKEIFKKYGIVIKNDKLLKVALTHSSYSNEHNTESYERLPSFAGEEIIEYKFA